MQIGEVAAFVEVARLGTISRAASALYLTQPALTARVQRLEADLGEPLFLRTPRGMRLTGAGRAFLPYAERTLAELEEGRRLVANLGAGRAGQLAIGAAPAVSTYVLPAVLKRFAEAYPGIQLSVRTGHTEEVLELVLREQVQVGLGRALRHPEIVSTPLYHEELVLVSEPGHPFATRGSIGIEELGREQLILFDRTSSYHELTNAFFRAAGVTPRGVMELDNIDATKKMVEQGLGVALLPSIAVAGELAGGVLARVEIEDAEPLRRQVVAIRRRDAGPPTGPVGGFLAVAGEVSPG